MFQPLDDACFTLDTVRLPLFLVLEIDDLDHPCGVVTALGGLHNVDRGVKPLDEACPGPVA